VACCEGAQSGNAVIGGCHPGLAVILPAGFTATPTGRSPRSVTAILQIETGRLVTDCARTDWLGLPRWMPRSVWCDGKI
jgi:hypothetical protein